MRKGPLLAAIGAVAAISIALLLYIWYLQPTQRAPALKVVVYSYLDVITGIDPSIEDDTGIVVLGSVYEPLLYYDPVRGEHIPALAESWESNEDGTVWTFRLRRGVIFHDGTPFTAEAVKLSIERARDIYRETGRGSGYIWDSVEEIEIVDDYTVRFKLAYPQRVDMLASAIYAGYIFSPSALEKAGVEDPLDPNLERWFNAGNEAGSGPYLIEFYSPESEVRLRKFEKWWGWTVVNNPDAPDVVIIRIRTDPLDQYNGLLAGEIDIASSVPRANLGDLKARGFQIINVSVFHNYILQLNCRRYPTNVTAFRLAVMHAIPWGELVDVALQGFGRLGAGVLPYNFPGYDGNLRYTYDLDLARKYLEKSGVKLPVKVEFVYQADYEENAAFAQLLKSRLADLGIDVELKPMAWTAVKEAGKEVWSSPENAPHLIINDWWPTLPSPYDYLYGLFHSESTEWNWAGYSNPVFDELINAAYEAEGRDYGEAMRLYRLAQKMVYEEGAGISLWEEIRPFVVSSRVEVPEKALNPLYIYVIFFQHVKVRG